MINKVVHPAVHNLVGKSFDKFLEVLCLRGRKRLLAANRFKDYADDETVFDLKFDLAFTITKTPVNVDRFVFIGVEENNYSKIFIKLRLGAVQLNASSEKAGGPKVPQLELLHSSPKLTDIIYIPEDRPYWNPAALHQKYIVELATMAQIAKEFFRSKGAVRSALIRAGIPIRKGIRTTGYGVKAVKGRPVGAGAEQKVIDTIVELRDGGMSFDKIAHFLTKMGVPTKTRRKKWNGGCVRVIYLRHREQPLTPR